MSENKELIDIAEKIVEVYQDALEQKHTDSINIFRNLAILNAELEQPKDALKFTEKYIQNTLDFSILKNDSYKFIKETNLFFKTKKK